MLCVRRLLSLLACASIATGRPSLLQPCALSGFSAASLLPPRRPLIWKVSPRLSHIHFGSSQAKTRREAISYFDLSRSKKKDDQDPTTRTEDQDRILLSPGPKQSFGGHYTGGRKLRSNPQSVLESLDSIRRQIRSILGDSVSAR